MKKTILLLCSLIASSQLGFSQVEYKVLESEKLQTKRELKIQLPRNYKSNVKKSYPLVLVFDGDYLFEPVAGNVEYYSYWEDMPEALVVGINQSKTRMDDTKYDLENYLPVDQGADFFEFIGEELLPLLEKNYRISNFRIVVGHDLTANLMNYYLLKENPIFDGYINLSADYTDVIKNNLPGILSKSKEKVWYYIATGTDDAELLKESNLQMINSLKEIENEKLYFYDDNFEEATHYSLVGRAIPKAIEDIFSVYRPITSKDYQEKVLKTKGTFYNYLVDKYEVIQKLYELDIKIRVSDFMTISSAIEEKKEFEQYEDLGKLAQKEHPESMIGSYFLARYNEELGKPKRALKEYQEAFSLNEASYLTKDMMIEKINSLKADLGL